MKFEWDSAKAESNKEVHGIGFNDAASVLQGAIVTKASSRDGEARFVSTGDLKGRLIAVVWTLRGDTVRLISARRARVHEREKYRQEIQRSADAR